MLYNFDIFILAILSVLLGNSSHQNFRKTWRHTRFYALYFSKFHLPHLVTVPPSLRMKS